MLIIHNCNCKAPLQMFVCFVWSRVYGIGGRGLPPPPPPHFFIAIRCIPHIHELPPVHFLPSPLLLLAPPPPPPPTFILCPFSLKAPIILPPVLRHPSPYPQFSDTPSPLDFLQQMTEKFPPPPPPVLKICLTPSIMQ